jgi:hypothetical protein
MKYQTILFSFLLLLCLSTSCQKAGQIHLISAHTWVVTAVSDVSNFAQVGDELTFHDNRLFFKNSSGTETDGQWNFLVSGSGFGPVRSDNVEGLYVSAGFGSYDFSITKLTNKELVISYISTNFIDFTVYLEPKE